MRIAYFHYLCAGDTALHHVQQFASAMNRLGHQVSVHAMNFHPGGANACNLGVRAIVKRRLARYAHEVKEVIWNPGYICRELAIVRAEKPDVLLSRTHYLTASAATVARSTGLPLVLEMNSPASESRLYQNEYWHLPWVGGALERQLVRSADRILVVSAALGADVASRCGVPSEKIVVNHNGVDVDRFHSAIRGDAVRAALGLAGKPVVGFVGSLYRWRGPELLAEIIRRLSREGVTFLLVGDGEEWQPFLASLGATARSAVVWSRRVANDRVPGYLAAMDVAFIPDSAFYMSPLKLFEYMAMGVPTVAPRREAIAEVVTHNNTALLFQPGSADDAVACLQRLLANPLQRRALGEAAARSLRGRFTWEANARRVLATCEWATRDRPRTERRTPTASELQ